MSDVDGGQPVRLAGLVIGLESLRARPRHYSDLFVAARAQDGHAFCLCTDPAPRLVIRARGEKFHLAGWPERGFEHAHGCPFHKTIPELSGSSAYTTTAVSEDEDGTRIHLTVPLFIPANPCPVGTFEPPPDARSDPGASPASMTLLGLLHWLWEAAQLNHWRPGWTRKWADCHQRLVRQAGDCRVDGQALADALYVVPPFTQETAEGGKAAAHAFTHQLGEAPSGTRYGLILGDLKEIAPTDYSGFRCRITHLYPSVIADAALIAKARESYRAALGDARPDKAKQVVLMLVTRALPQDPKRARQPGAGYLKAVDMAAMLTSRTYVPADSSHEVDMADALTAAGRSFVKPLRYDARDATLPDFALLDTDPATYVEVYGMDGNPAYTARKQAKTRHYLQTGRPVIEWNTKPPLPDLTRPS